MAKNIKSAGNFASNNLSESGLATKFFNVLVLLIIFRIGTYIPLPGINYQAMVELSNTQAGGILGMFNMFTGGALERMSIFALNIMPYITASIIIQLLTVLSNELSQLKKEGESGRKKINQYTRYLTLLLAALQGYGMSAGIEQIETSVGSVVTNPGFFFRIVSTISLVGGTLFVMWLGERISSHGIGNGSSIIIFTGIIAGLPSALVSFFEMGRLGSLPIYVIVLVSLMVSALVLLIVFMEKSQRRITIQYPRRQVGNKLYAGDSTHLPLKLNTAGVIPPIFASSLLLFPTTILTFTSMDDASGWKQMVFSNLAHGKPLFVVLYTLLIIFFCFFYTSIVFNPEETAENLRKNGGVVLGRRPGKNTAEYLDHVLTRITAIGACYIAAICVIPEVFIAKYSIPFYLGGTSLLIVVNVVIDVFMQIQAHSLGRQYQQLLKKQKFMGKA